jgi:hypothetical protein
MFAARYLSLVLSLACLTMASRVCMAQPQLPIGDEPKFVASPSKAELFTTAVILPGNFTLFGPACRQRLVIEERRDDGRYIGMTQQDVNGVSSITFKSSDEKVVRIEDGVALPVANGTATITGHALLGVVGKMASVTTPPITVKVTDMDKPFQWSFRNHVESVMLKSGCTTGPCHGAQSGKGGFKLSLRGYDAEGDYTILTRQARGRRVNATDPGRSLILTKPTGAVPHKGGVRFDTKSLEYKIISEWIAAGTPGPTPQDARIERIEILPPNVVLAKAQKQQLLVRAHFSDGRIEDVTRWTLFSSANESAVQINTDGVATTVGYGEGAVTAWYLSKVATAAISVPQATSIPADVFAKSPKKNFIDEAVVAKLQSLGIKPSANCTDGEFIRRAFVDTLGILPTAEETRTFLADKDPNKRDKLIDAILARPEFIDYWAYKWSDLLLVNGERLRFGSADNKEQSLLWSYYSWVRNHVEADTPWDQLVRELVTASGSNLENGASNYFLLHQDPLDLAETTTVAFLGLNINCARCHNHPLEKWTNDQYYSMANLFSRVRVKADPATKSSVVFADVSGELVQPLTGKPRIPTPLDGTPIALDDPRDRRVHMAKWLTAPENPYFARSVTNRVWANFFGRGLVELVDDMRLTNPPSNSELLDAAAKHLVDNKFHLKTLMKAILQSAAYQRSSIPEEENKLDDRFYSRYYPKRLMAEVMLDGVSSVTQVPTTFTGFPQGWRALQLPSSSAASYFLSTFGRPDRLVTCTCERTDQPTMVQVLHISNGSTMNEKLKAADNVIAKSLAAKKPDGEILDEVFLAALSRPATASEKDRLLKELTAVPAAEKRQAWEDVYWSILSSKEFLFNH